MKLCIAHGGDLSEPSGGTDRITAFAVGLQENGYDVTIVTPRPNGEFPERLAEVNLITVPVRAKGVTDQLVRATLVSRRARKYAEREDAILQFEHSTLSGIATYVGCSDFVIDMHDFAFPSPLYGDLPLGQYIQRAVRHIEGRGVHHAAQIVVVSEKMREFTAEEWNIPEDRFTVIPNGYFGRIRQEFGDIEEVDGRVVFLGTLHPKVDTDALVSVAQLPEVEEMIVIGDGEQREVLERQKKVSASTELEITGRLPDEEAFRLLASASLAVNPQYTSRLQRASSPVKLYYYAALGRPMVLTDGPEAARWLAEEGAADIVDPEQDFASAVRSLLRDDARRRNMASSASRAGQKSTWSSRVENLVNMYDSSYERIHD